MTNRTPDLNEIIENTYEYIPEGDVYEPSGAEGRNQNATGSGGKTTLKPTAWVFKDPKSIPPREWLYERHYIRKFVSVDIAAGAVGKTSLLLLEAVGMACGRNLLTGERFKPLRVWYHNGEDPAEELDRRVAAICLHYGVTEEDIGGRLFIDSGRKMPIVIAYEQRGDFKVAVPTVEALKQAIDENQFDVLICDPFVSYHAVSENLNDHIDRVAKLFGGVAEDCNIAVDLSHHARKLNGGEISAEDARGGIALIAAARCVRTFRPMLEQEAVKAGIETAERRHFFRVDDGAKANLSPVTAASWRRFIGVALGNDTTDRPGDWVGVVTAWEWPDAFEGVTADDLKAVQRAIYANEWRKDPQAKAWVGKAVADTLGLDLDDKAVKQRVKDMLKAWLASGALVVVKKPDGEYKDREYVEVGKWVE